MKKVMMILWTLMVVLGMHAQMVDPVHFTSELKMGEGTEAEIIFHATIDNGWHVYSTEIGEDGPIEATFNVEKMEGAELVGKLTPKGKVIKKMDKLFNMELKYFEKEATFVQKIRFTKPQYDIDCYLEYGACSDASCLPPSEIALKQKGKSPAIGNDKGEDRSEKTEVKSEKTEEGSEKLEADSASVTSLTPPSSPLSNETDLWAPVTEQLRALGTGEELAKQSLLWLLLMGFVAGLLAICMPCIWPIIPMTVSFFLKRSKDKKKGIRDAITYGISIIVIYLALGLLVTAIFGAQTLNDLATNAVFNLIFCALLVVFALSFFGWFELTLPSSWTNKVDNKASETSGLLSIFLMAFTLTLVSFSCTGPIIGLLLVETTTSGNWMGPAIGMLGFAIALALPFTLFALFPTWLKQAPKSGSWMNTIKVVLGFIELAFALKFFSVADLAYGWRLLDREVFLALWIAIFLFLGLYLIGILKFQSDQGSDKAMPVPCIMLGLVSIAFAVYMVPGLWGAPCRAVSAFAPPLYTQDFNLNTKEVRAAYTNYEEGMAAAKASGKPVMLDFTGFGCVNCRKMEIAVWTDPTVADKLNKDYVLISLFVDDKTPLDQPIEVQYNGKKRTLRTIGDKWSYLEEMKFGHLTQPLYVLVDNDGNPMTRSFSYKEDVGEYLKFLGEGLKKYKSN